MAFAYLGYQFDGAYNSPDSLESNPGVYIIWCICEDEWQVIDVGESNDVKDEIKNHERKPCWEKHCPFEIYFSATYTPNLPQPERLRIEDRIRKLTNPPCGKR